MPAAGVERGGYTEADERRLQRADERGKVVEEGHGRGDGERGLRRLGRQPETWCVGGTELWSYGCSASSATSMTALVSPAQTRVPRPLRSLTVAGEAWRWRQRVRTVPWMEV